MSFHGRSVAGATAGKLRRPRTVPDLMSWERNYSPAKMPKLTKVLLNVNVQGSVGPVQVLVSPESSVSGLISAVLKQYSKEGRRPMITGSTIDDFDLHYSQFSLESLDREEKIATLGSRNFFLCKRKTAGDGVVLVSSCSTQAEKLGFPSPWLKFMSFMF